MKRLLILGAGYGGLALAQKFDSLTRNRDEWEIVLVDQHDYHLIQVRVHEVAANSIPADRVKIPLATLLDGRHVKFVQATINKIDPNGKTVDTSAGKLAYDRLVVGLGSVTSFSGVEGMEEYAYPIKHLEDALAFRKAVIRAFKTTAESKEPLVKNDPRLTFVVIGGGITGTELAGEMVDFCHDLCKRFPNLRPYFRVVLIEGGETLLAQLGKSNGEYMKAELRARNVAVLTSTRVVKVEPGKVYLKNGKLVKGSVVAWAGGVMAPPLIKESGFETTGDGRIRTNSYLRSEQFPDVYAIGDCALILDPETGKPILQTGQYAEWQGSYLAESFHAEMRGMKPTTYVPFSLGISISLGRTEALTLTGPIRLTGIPGRIAKDVSYGKHELQIRTKPLLVG